MKQKENKKTEPNIKNKSNEKGNKGNNEKERNIKPQDKQGENDIKCTDKRRDRRCQGCKVGVFVLS